MELCEEWDMLVSEIKEVDLTIDFIDKLLFQGFEDTGEDADCIVYQIYIHNSRKMNARYR